MALPALEPSQRPEWQVATYVYAVEVDDLGPGDAQPRILLDDADDLELVGLARTIERAGVIHPLLVQEQDGQVRIIAGERRWRAAKLLKRRDGLDRYTVPVIFSAAVPAEVEEIALISNVQHADLLPIELFLAYRRLLETRTMDELALAIGQKADTLARFMATMRDDILGAPIASGRLSVSNAREIVRLDAVAKAEMVRLIAQYGLQRDAIRRAVKALRSGTRPGRTADTVRNIVVAALNLDQPRPSSGRTLAPVTQLRPLPVAAPAPAASPAPSGAQASPAARAEGGATTPPPTEAGGGLLPTHRQVLTGAPHSASAPPPRLGGHFPGVGVAPAAPPDSSYQRPDYQSPQRVRAVRTLTLYLKNVRDLLLEKEDDLRLHGDELAIQMGLQEIRDEASRLLGETARRAADPPSTGRFDATR